MYRLYSCIYLISIIFFQACKPHTPENTSIPNPPPPSPIIKPTAPENKPLVTPPSGEPQKPTSSPPTTVPLESPIRAPRTLELVLKNISNGLIDWKKNQGNFKTEIEELEKIAEPFSIEDTLSAKRKVDDALLMRLANYNNKATLDEIKRNSAFALDIIILIKTLVDIAQIPTHLEKDIKAVPEILLIDPTIKLAYYRLLAKKSDPKKILEIYAKKSYFDMKIYNESIYDSPDKYVTNPINWTIKSKHGDMDFTQYPALNQQNGIKDPTDYCGYYAIYASVLNNPASFQEFGDRQAFREFFETSLEAIKEARIESSSTDTTEGNLLLLSHLDHTELLELTATFGVNIKNLDLSSDFMAENIAADEDTIVIPNIIKQFLKVHDKKDNVDTQVFVGNTSVIGVHWLAFSLEKRKGTLIIKLVDSLGKNNKALFERWFPASIISI